MGEFIYLCMTEGKLIVVDDNTAVLKTLRRVLATEFCTVITISTPTVLPVLLKEGDVDLVLLDMNFSKNGKTGDEGLFWVDKILALSNPPAIVVMTAYEDLDIAIASFKKGVVDFIRKPWENEKLLAVLNEALAKRRQKDLKKELNPLLEFPDYLLRKYARLYAKTTPSLTIGAREKLLDLLRAGEIELLDNSIEQTVLLSDSSELSESDFFIESKDVLSLEHLSLENMEKQLISFLLNENKRNMATCADILKVSRQTLYNKVKKYNL